jgi:hypothetical protein
MSLPKKDTKGAKPVPPVEDEYALKTPVSAPAAPDLADYLLPSRKPVDVSEPLPPPPKIAFLSGIYEFPFHFRTLGVWALISFGLTLSALGLMLCIWLVDIGLTIAARCFALPEAWIALLSFGYASICLLEVIQVTSEGYDVILDWPAVDWREWVWSLRYTAGMVVPAGLIAAGVQWCASPLTNSWLPGVVTALVLYPLLLLAALETGTPLSVMSGPVFRSLATLWWGWLAVYLQAGVLIGAWWWLTSTQFPNAPVVTVLVAGPALAAILLICARLLGRLVWRAQPAADRDDEDE